MINLFASSQNKIIATTCNPSNKALKSFFAALMAREDALVTKILSYLNVYQLVDVILTHPNLVPLKCSLRDDTIQLAPIIPADVPIGRYPYYKAFLLKILNHVNHVRGGVLEPDLVRAIFRSFVTNNREFRESLLKPMQEVFPIPGKPLVYIRTESDPRPFYFGLRESGATGIPGLPGYREPGLEVGFFASTSLNSDDESLQLLNSGLYKDLSGTLRVMSSVLVQDATDTTYKYTKYRNPGPEEPISKLYARSSLSDGEGVVICRKYSDQHPKGLLTQRKEFDPQGRAQKIDSIFTPGPLNGYCRHLFQDGYLGPGVFKHEKKIFQPHPENKGKITEEETYARSPNNGVWVVLKTTAYDPCPENKFQTSERFEISEKAPRYPMSLLDVHPDCELKITRCYEAQVENKFLLRVIETYVRVFPELPGATWDLKRTQVEYHNSARLAHRLRGFFMPSS